MNETLIIRNFGPIGDKGVKLDLSKINVFIGESGTGKSTIAKVLAVCRYFSYIVGEDNEINNSFESGLDAWGLKEYYSIDTYIEYNCDHYKVIAKKIKYDEVGDFSSSGTEFTGSTEIFTTQLTEKSEVFKSLMLEYKRLKSKSQTIDGYGFNDFEWQPPTSFYINDVKKVLENPFFVHTERSLNSYFTLSKDSIQNVSSALDVQFRRLYEISNSYFKKEIEIEPLNIYYKNVNNVGLIRNKNNSNYYTIANAASGYKMVIPIVLLMKYYKYNKRKSKSFIIEEPELSISPTTQKELVNFFAENLDFTHSHLITTHSPYILTSLNNLMYAYQVGQKHKDEVSKIIEEKYWVNPDDVRCYMMKDGEAELIIDEETRLIDTVKIDGVSDILSDEFNKIMALELG